MQLLTLNHSRPTLSSSSSSAAFENTPLSFDLELQGAESSEVTIQPLHQENSLHPVQGAPNLMNTNVKLTKKQSSSKPTSGGALTFIDRSVPPVSPQEGHRASTTDTGKGSNAKRRSKHSKLKQYSNGGSHHKTNRVKRSAALREVFPAASNMKTSENHHPTRTYTQNFTLNIQNGKVLLYQDKAFIIDLTLPKKMTLAVTNSVSYARGTISITAGITEAQYFPHIQWFVVYNGTDVHTLTPANTGTLLTATTGQLFVSRNRAFYSSSVQFNTLLNENLAQIFSNINKPESQVQFRTLIGGKNILMINKTSIIILTDAEFRSVSDRQFLLYRNNTLRVQEVTESDVVEIFPQIEQVYLLYGVVGKGTKKYQHTLTDKILGGGELYVNKLSKTAFYSRDSTTNKKISEFLESLMPPYHKLVLSIKFQASTDGRTLEVVISANRDEVMRLKPNQVIDQSVAPQHYIAYHNNTMYVMDGDAFLDILDNIHQIRLYNEETLEFHTTSLVQQIPGGGQLFVCEGVGLYSVDTSLNDRIGDALLGAETHSSCFPNSFSGQ